MCWVEVIFIEIIKYVLKEAFVALDSIWNLFSFSQYQYLYRILNSMKSIREKPYFPLFIYRVWYYFSTQRSLFSVHRYLHQGKMMLQTFLGEFLIIIHFISKRKQWFAFIYLGDKFLLSDMSFLKHQAKYIVYIVFVPMWFKDFLLTICCLGK